MLNSAIDSNLREKYLWLKKKTEKAVEYLQQIKELYDEEKEQTLKQEMALFHEKMKVFQHLPEQQVDGNIEGNR